MMGARMDDWDGSKIIKMPADDLDRGLSLMSPVLVDDGGGKSLREAPPIISESMMFPYLRGMVFCAKLANNGGWEADRRGLKKPARVDRADPPPREVPDQARPADDRSTWAS